MASWTTILDATLDPGKPPTSSIFKALRDNPIAIAEGASGAPKVKVENALESTGSNGEVLTVQSDGSIEAEAPSSGTTIYGRGGGGDGGGGVVQFGATHQSNSDFSYSGGEITYSGPTKAFIVSSSGNWEIDQPSANCEALLQFNTGTSWITGALTRGASQQASTSDKDYIPWAVSRAITLVSGDKIRVFNNTSANDVQNATITFIG